MLVRRATLLDMTRLVLLALAVLVLVLLVIGIYQAIRISRLVNTGHELAATAKPYEQRPATPTATIVVTGDSSAVGVGAATQQESVAGRLGQRYPSASIENTGHNGERVSGLLVKLQQRTAENPTKRYDLVLLQIGGNDLIRRTSYTDLERDLPLLLDEAKKLSDQIVLINGGNYRHIPMFPWPIDLYMDRRSRLGRDLFSRIAAQKGVAYVDLYRPAREERDRDHRADYAADQFHLNGTGYAWWFDGIVRTIDAAGYAVPATK